MNDFYDKKSFAYVGSDDGYTKQTLNDLDMYLAEKSLLECEEVIFTKDEIKMIVESAFSTDDDIYVEGTNRDIGKVYRKCMRQVKPNVKKIKALFKKQKYEEAKKLCIETEKILKDAEKEIDFLATISEDSPITLICGIVLKEIKDALTSFLVSIVTFPFKKASKTWRDIKDTKDSLNVINGCIKKVSSNKEITIGEFNEYINRAKKGISEMTKIVVAIEERIDYLEKEGTKLESTSSVEESSASVNGPMLPQGQGSGKGVDDNSLKDMISDVDKEASKNDDMVSDDIFDESLQDTVSGVDIYYEASLGIISKLASKMKKEDVKGPREIRKGKVKSVCKLYATMKLNSGRMKTALEKDSSARSTDYFKKAQKAAINAEKELRKQKKDLTPEELSYFNSYCQGFDKTFNASMEKQIAKIKKQKESVKKESVEFGLNEYEDCSVLTESGFNDLCGILACGIDSKFKQHKEYYLASALCKKNLSTKDLEKWAKKILEDEKESVKKESTYDIFEESTLSYKDFLDVGFSEEEIQAIFKDMNDIAKNISDIYNKQKTKKLSNGEPVSKYIKSSYSGKINTKCKYEKKESVIEASYEDIIYTDKNIAKNLDKDIKDELRNIIYDIENSAIKSKKPGFIIRSMGSEYDSICIYYKKKVKKGLLGKTKEVYESAYDIFEEVANIDKAIEDEIKKLNDKGYKTKYSSAGHNTLTRKEDPNKDGVYYGKLYSDARIMFDGKYDFPDAPKYWVWKDVDGNDYLDIIPFRYDKKDGNKDEAFQKWKDKYLGTLNTWIDNLPDRKSSDDESDEEEPEKEDEQVNEESTYDVDNEIDTLYESVINDIIIDLM